MKKEFSIIIPIKNRASIKVNYEPPGLSIFKDHIIELSNLPKKDIDKKGTDIKLDLLINNLDSLLELLDKYSFEVILVDFGSDDYNKKKIKESYKKLDLKIIEEKSFFSRGKGLNMGMELVTKKNVMFCDADMYFKSEEVFKNAISELDKGNVFFPICFDLIEPSHQIGYWRESGYGIMFSTKKLLEKLNFRWSEYESLGKEDDDAFAFFNNKNLTSRYRVTGYYHQWHPSSKFFKNSNYKSANVSPNTTKILMNFNEELITDINLKKYIGYLKKDKLLYCTNNLESDTSYVIFSKNLEENIQRKQIEEYEKKYCRKIKILCLEKYPILPDDYSYFERYQENPKWLNLLLDWIIRIERNDYSWTLQGGNGYPLSALTLFAKLIKIYDNFFYFDKTKLRNIIVRYIDESDLMFKPSNDIDKIISESRQGYSALINLGYNIIVNEKYNVKLENYYGKPLYFMNDKYWENPWKAGAHLSHYIFFCNMKNDHKEINNVFNELKKYKKKDGWYYGNPTEEQIINGIMKVLTAFDIIGKEINPDIGKGIIDRLLSTDKYAGGCGVYDYVYVLVRCLAIKHRENEIRTRLYKVYDTILEYQMPDGGFKYSKDINKKDTYSGKEITPAGPYGCIHATTVFSMALTMMNKALDMGLNINLAFS